MDHPKQHSSTPAWLRNISQVDWTCIFFIISLGIGTYAIQRTPAVQRPFQLDDATISFPHQPDSVAFWVAPVLPAVILLISAVVLEFLVFRQQGGRQAGMMLLNIILAFLACLAVTGFLTELFKRICGRLRPDFLDRCAPIKPPPGGLEANYGSFTSPTCTTPPGYKLKDGRYSFPSGHSSCSMAAGLFGALYLLWAVHARNRRDVLGPQSACRNGRLCFARWLGAELLRLVVLLVALFLLAWPWGVAVSRFRDNRHNVSDVVGGLLLGACFAPMFIMRLVVHYQGWLEVDEQQQLSGVQLQLQASNAAVPVALLPISDGHHRPAFGV